MVASSLEPHDAPRRRHAVIAGTGRAGTSFLVRFLESCGLDTGATEMPMPFDPRARAGLERNLLDGSAPYIVKDPWLFAYCDQIDPAQIEVEALLVPVRDLAATATSRILQERITMADSFWADLPASDVHGMVAGGAVYSLDPLDEARILAVGFHRLILWATARQIPLFLLEFPRIVKDGDYLIDTLWPWLGDHCEKDHAVIGLRLCSRPGPDPRGGSTGRRSRGKHDGCRAPRPGGHARAAPGARGEPRRNA